MDYLHYTGFVLSFSIDAYRTKSTRDRFKEKFPDTFYGLRADGTTPVHVADRRQENKVKKLLGNVDWRKKTGI
jgi:hypothetical protein